MVGAPPHALLELDAIGLLFRLLQLVVEVHMGVWKHLAHVDDAFHLHTLTYPSPYHALRLHATCHVGVGHAMVRSLERVAVGGSSPHGCLEACGARGRRIPLYMSSPTSHLLVLCCVSLHTTCLVARLHVTHHPYLVQQPDPYLVHTCTHISSPPPLPHSPYLLLITTGWRRSHPTHLYARGRWGHMMALQSRR